ncbi:MAG TPA: helix-turn-helix transcriptional regulator [Ramlibacter sp.]|nr:helix-turn-helix transcriptional regulator [Ramlibacter sp.]
MSGAQRAPRKFDPRRQLGQRIKALRAERALTQEELADRCEIFRTYMSRIESGLANPTLTMLHQLAKGLDVDVRELLVPGEGPVPARVNSSGPRLSRGRVSS